MQSPELEEAFEGKWVRALPLLSLKGLKCGVNWVDREEEEEEWAWHCKRLGLEVLLNKQIMVLQGM